MKLLLAVAAGAAVGTLVVRKLAQDPQIRDAVNDLKVQTQAAFVELRDELNKAKDKMADTVKDQSI